MGQDPGDQGKKKPDLRSAIAASKLTAQTTTRAKVAVPRPAERPPETTTQARTVAAGPAHVPTSVKRDPQKAPTPVIAAKPAPASGIKKKAPPNAKKVAWDPRRIRRFLNGQLTLGELEDITKKEQYDMAKSGHRLLRQGKHEQAEKIFRGLLSLDPRDAYFHLAVGSCAQRRGDASGAEQSYTASLKINPYSPHALANRGEVRLMLGRMVDGARDLMAAVEQDPELKQPPTRRAQATLRMLQAQLLALGIQPPPPKAAPPKAAPRSAAPRTAAPRAGAPRSAPRPAPGAAGPRPFQTVRPPGPVPRPGAGPRRPPPKK